MSQEELIVAIGAVVGVILSLVTSFVPAVANWFYSQPSDKRGLIMVVVNLVAALLLVAISCLGLFAYTACSVSGLKTVILAWFYMLISGQVTYSLSPASPTKAAIQARQYQQAVTAYKAEQASKKEG